ncbi:MULTISPECIES: hypothetical protein [unclassified Haladaptatus]|nr:MULTISPECIES: hypothetical protein [unclassified Haladaptatus]
MDSHYAEVYSEDFTFLSFKRGFQLVVGAIFTFLVWANLAASVGMSHDAGTGGPYALVLSLAGGAVLFSTWNRPPPSFTENSSLNMVLESAIRLTLFLVGVVAFYWLWTFVTAASTSSPAGFTGNMLLVFVPFFGAVALLRVWNHVSTLLFGRGRVPDL